MLYDKLYSWQKKIVDEFYEKPSLGLFLDMGLGKTPISLAFAEKNNCSRILVISINAKALETSDNKGSWSNWCQYLYRSPLVLNKKEYSKLSKFSFTKCLNKGVVYITNYESLFSRTKDRKDNLTLKDDIKEFIQSCKDQNVAIIVDESHKMKDTSSMQTKAIMKIKSMINVSCSSLKLYLLTGTPFTVGYIDLYSQLKFLGYEETKTDFIERFCIRGNIKGLLGWQQPIIGYKNVKRLYELIHRFALTIKSEDVIELPDKIFVDHIISNSLDMKMYSREKISNKAICNYIKNNVESGEVQLELLNRYKNLDIQSQNPFYRNIDFPQSRWMADTTGTLWMRARELSIGFQGNADEYRWFNRNRLDALKSFLSEHVDNYLIFYNYTPELFEIFEICEKLKYNIDVYCGEIKSLYNYDRYSKLNEDEKIANKNNVIIANFQSGSTGMNWQEYDKCIIFSLPLYSHYEQGIKRIHRLGQKETTIYHMFYEDNWLDKSMLAALKEQIEYSDKMFETDFKKQSLLISV